jgi:hypothetical protein
LVHGSAEDGNLGTMNGSREIEKAFIDRPHGSRSFEAGLLSPGADHALRKATALGGQTNRAADETDANDG